MGLDVPSSYKSISFIIVASIISSLSTIASSSSCETFYQNEKFDQAIPLCIKEEDYFRLGLIYSKKNDCAKIKKYYGMSTSSAAKGNMALSLLTGNYGCEKDIDQAIELLEVAINLGDLGFANVLGDHYKRTGSKALAKKYYQLSIDLEKRYTDWGIDRVNESFTELKNLLDEEEKKQFYFKIIEYEGSSQQWKADIADQAFRELKSILVVSEQLDLFFGFLRNGGKYKCELGAYLYSQRFNNLIVELRKQNRQEKFLNGLGNCDGKKQYFLALTYENGLGNKEDFREAYRLYLIAGSKGNVNAKSARDRIRNKLSVEQISQATCLADYGIEPSTIRKWMCKW